MKKFVLGILFVFASVCCFAAENENGVGMYMKADVGYAFWAPDVNNVYCESDCFDFDAAFGLFPITGNRNFAVEASVDCNFGGKDELKTTVIAPKIMSLFYIPMESLFGNSSLVEHFMPYTGLGFSIPIQKVEYAGISELNTGFKIDLQFGFGFEINDKLVLCVDWNSGLLRPWSWSVGAGIIYIFK
ncbi:MAG: outer membrane beta-barrel protein [Treponema sp.]|nr:outer membrane beta-barrel protein [Treponema sp.]